MVYKLTDFWLLHSLVTNMIRCDICDKGFIRRDNMLRHKRTINYASDEDLADESKESDADFEADDGMDTDEEAMESENMDQLAARAAAFKQLRSPYRKAITKYFIEKCCGTSWSNMIAFLKLLKNL